MPQIRNSQSVARLKNVELTRNTAIIQRFAGKAPLPDPFLAGKTRTILVKWPDLPLA
jgi:hypothetical protein